MYMKPNNQYEAQKYEREAKEVLNLYKQHVSLRKVGMILDKSHEWVRRRLNYAKQVVDKENNITNS